jgi:hypothetical protein
MRSIQRGGRLALVVAPAVLSALLSAAPATAAAATATATAATAAATWTLQDVDQRICLRPGESQPHTNTYVFTPVTGTWSSTITTGIRNFPPGSHSDGGTPFPPGSHDGSYVNGFRHVSIAPAAAGDYQAEVWATDGTVTQAVPVLLRYTDGWCWP